MDLVSILTDKNREIYVKDRKCQQETHYESADINNHQEETLASRFQSIRFNEFGATEKGNRETKNLPSKREVE
jgi:hypothetical protein